MHHSEIETKTEHICKLPECEQKIAEQVAIATGSDSLRLIGVKTGYTAETARRYLKADSRIPADFIRQIALQYKLDSNKLLCISNPESVKLNLQVISTDVLINELGRRMKMVENCAMASVVVKSGMF